MVTAAVARTGANRSFQPVNFTDRYVRHRDLLGYIEPVSSSSSAQVKRDSTFNVVAGLADPNCHSFVGTGGRYLRHASFRLRVDVSDRQRAVP